MCGDYRALSKITIKNQYSLPNIDDLFDQLQLARFLTKLDLKLGYHHIRVKEEDMLKAAIKTKRLYKWILGPLSLCNTTTTFMMVMIDILHPSIVCFVMMYLGGIFVFNKTWKYHLIHLKKNFETMKSTQRTHLMYSQLEEI
jgi:hypothetical protein